MRACSSSRRPVPRSEVHMLVVDSVSKVGELFDCPGVAPKKGHVTLCRARHVHEQRVVRSLVLQELDDKATASPWIAARRGCNLKDGGLCDVICVTVCSCSTALLGGCRPSCCALVRPCSRDCEPFPRVFGQLDIGRRGSVEGFEECFGDASHCSQVHLPSDVGHVGLSISGQDTDAASVTHLHQQSSVLETAHLGQGPSRPAGQKRRCAPTSHRQRTSK